MSPAGKAERPEEKWIAEVGDFRNQVSLESEAPWAQKTASGHRQHSTRWPRRRAASWRAQPECGSVSLLSKSRWSGRKQRLRQGTLEPGRATCAAPPPYSRQSFRLRHSPGAAKFAPSVLSTPPLLGNSESSPPRKPSDLRDRLPETHRPQERPRLAPMSLGAARCRKE